MHTPCQWRISSIASAGDGIPWQRLSLAKRVLTATARTPCVGRNEKGISATINGKRDQQKIEIIWCAGKEECGTRKASHKRQNRWWWVTWHPSEWGPCLYCWIFSTLFSSPSGCRKINRHMRANILRHYSHTYSFSQANEWDELRHDCRQSSSDCRWRVSRSVSLATLMRSDAVWNWICFWNGFGAQSHLVVITACSWSCLAAHTYPAAPANLRNEYARRSSSYELLMEIGKFACATQSSDSSDHLNAWAV